MDIQGFDSNGRTVNIRTNDEGVLLSADISSRYELSVLEETVFTGANLGGTPVTTQAGLSATTPALTLYNPVGSGVNLVLLNVSVNVTTAPAAVAGLMLAFNALNATPPATTTTATVTNAIIGFTGTPKGQCFRIATLAAAPVAFNFIGSVGAASTALTTLFTNIDGLVIIPPGVAISIQSTSAIAITANYTWKEISL